MNVNGLASYPRRIVCLTEETTETLYLLGEQDRIVGVSGYTVRPPEARQKPKVSAFINAKFDKILALEPDLVFAFSDLQADIAAELIRRGLDVLTFNQRSVTEILEMILTVGRIVGVEAKALQLVLSLQSHLEAIGASAARFDHRPRVFFEEWNDPLISGIRWVDELLEIAGGDCIFPYLRRQQAAKDRIVNPADVIPGDPEVIIASWCGRRVKKNDIRARAGWETITACRENHIYEVKSTFILQPGPAALTEGVRQLHAILARTVNQEVDADLLPREKSAWSDVERATRHLQRAAWSRTLIRPRLLMKSRRPSFSGKKLAKLQRLTFDYFLKETNPDNGLVLDNTRPNVPCSIAATGFALAAYPVGVERGFITRKDAIKRTLATLRFFFNSRQGREPDATGYKGFYYHFLDMKTGRRVWNCELSTVDSTFLLAGALTAAEYFARNTGDERELRELGEALYRRADWQWAQNRGAAVTMGWKPESGFLKYRWQGYDEALILYILGLASPTFPLPESSYGAWSETYQWKKLYGHEFVYAGPLFTHQLSHIWIDFRVIQDEYMRGRGIDYFENSRRATYIQQQYAIRNPRGFKGYDENIWGLTASDGPGPARKMVGGKMRRFYDYMNRGVPNGPDDGTLAPWAVVASLPFAPEIVLPSLRHFDEAYPEMTSKYGFKCSFNPSFSGTSDKGWISKGYYGIDQGPIVLMIENYRSEFLWRLMKSCRYLRAGLRRAGFKGGWLSD